MRKQTNQKSRYIRISQSYAASKTCLIKSILLTLNFSKMWDRRNDWTRSLVVHQEIEPKGMQNEDNLPDEAIVNE